MIVLGILEVKLLGTAFNGQPRLLKETSNKQKYKTMYPPNGIDWLPDQVH